MAQGRLAMREAFRRLEALVPERLAGAIRWLRLPRARWVRWPAGVLLMIGGVFSFLPVLGIWMLPLGLLLIAVDVPPLRGPVGRCTVWCIERAQALRRRLASRA